MMNNRHSLSFVLISIFILSFFAQKAYPKDSWDDTGLVDVRKVAPTVIVRMMYAATSNFTGRKLYEKNICMLRQSVAVDIAAAENEFAQLGCRLEMLDCYRPKRISLLMWSIGAEHNRQCMALGAQCVSGGCNPGEYACLWAPLSNYVSRNSKHNRGASVDIALVCGGKNLDMGVPADFFGPESRTRNAKGEFLENRLLMKRIMERHGFRNYFREWWHYDNNLYKNYKPLDQPVK